MNQELPNEDFLGMDDLNDLFADDTSQPVSPLSEETPASPRDLNFFRHIPVKVTLEVASVELPLGDLMQVAEGTVIELDKMAGEPLDVKVNGRLLARGEVVVVNGKYGLRLIDIVDQQAIGYPGS